MGCITGRSSGLPVLCSGYGQLPDVASGGQPDALLASDRSKRVQLSAVPKAPLCKGSCHANSVTEDCHCKIYFRMIIFSKTSRKTWVYGGISVDAFA